MKKKTFLPFVLISVFLLAGVPGVAFAGFDPTPFHPEINKLGAIENSLHSIDRRIKAVLAVPPNDIRPAPAKRINAMAHQLELLNGFMASTMGEIIDAVLGVPPDDQSPIIDALEGIGSVMSNDSAEGGIADVVEAYLNEYFPAGEGIQPELMEFYNALIQFSGNATAIIITVGDYIEQITGGPADCGSYETEEACVAAGCTWIFDSFSCGYPLE